MSRRRRASRKPHPTQERAVFVDPSGRRIRRVRLFGFGVLAIAAAYVALVALPLFAGSTVDSPVLPESPSAEQGPRTPNPIERVTSGDDKKPDADHEDEAGEAPAPSPEPVEPAPPSAPEPPTQTAPDPVDTPAPAETTEPVDTQTTSPVDIEVPVKPAQRGKSAEAPGQTNRPAPPELP